MGPPKLVLNGIALETPFVGLGVHTARLIRGLLSHPASPSFKVLLTPQAAALSPWLPSDRRELIAPARVPNSFLRGLLTSERIARRALHKYPEAIFHSPVPHWSTARPARTVVTLHDATYRRFPLYQGKWGMRRLWMLATEGFARRATRVITISRAAERDLIDLSRIPPEKIRVVHNWVGPEFFNPISAETIDTVRHRLRLPRKFWLYVGGYDYRKNVELLLEAYAEVRRLGPGIPPLVLAGGLPPLGSAPPFGDPLGVLRRLGLEDAAALFPGVIADADMPALYRAASLLVYPSLYEGFGLPPAEAMAVGTSVLVSDCSSLTEVVPRETCRFDPRMLPALVEKLVVAARDPQAFRCPLRPEFRESHAIDRYLRLLFPEEVALPAR